MTAHQRILDGETAASQMKHARSALGRSYQLDPLRPVNLYYFSLAGRDQPDYPSDNIITAAIQAHDLAPSVDEYAINAAVLLIHKSRMDEAKEMLYPLASNPHSQQLAQRMQAVIAAIDAGKSAPEIMATLAAPALGEDGNTPPPGKEGKDGAGE